MARLLDANAALSLFRVTGITCLRDFHPYTSRCKLEKTGFRLPIKPCKSRANREKFNNL